MNAPMSFAAPEAFAPVDISGCEVSDLSLSELVADVYEAAPAGERGHLLEPLLRPLGILSLFGVAGGIFAKAKLRGGWQDIHIRLEDIQSVRRADVAALFDYAQQVSAEAIDGLAGLLVTSPLLSGSAAAILLATALVRRSRAGFGHGESRMADRRQAAPGL